jgi:hypothetical protein
MKENIRETGQEYIHAVQITKVLRKFELKANMLLHANKIDINKSSTITLIIIINKLPHVNKSNLNRVLQIQQAADKWTIITFTIEQGLYE